MITGIIFKEEHKIEFDKHERFTLPDSMIEKSFKIDESTVGKNRTAAKDVMYVRYDIGSITPEFIKENMGKFKDSVHIVRLYVKDMDSEKLSRIAEIENLVIHAVIEAGIEDKSDNSEFRESDIDKLQEVIAVCNVDEIIIKDCGGLTNPDLMAARKELKAFRINKIAVCGSPLTTCENCCLSPELMRNYAATYGNERTALAVNGYRVDDVGCRCVRGVEITEDILVEKKETKKAVKESSKSTEGVTKKKEPKAGKFDNAEDVWF